ncbi:hypothetical protein ABZZ79_12400 [Streptomyces sp. NPDC006458]|uniref:hypothetical protein n=1 Tax=Streptomyces sp. NPDC006458 TaxID=3154302 RepID=UPI00339ECED2
MEMNVGLLVQARLGVLGVALFLAVGVGVRARRDDLAVAAAVLATVLMLQA